MCSIEKFCSKYDFDELPIKRVLFYVDPKLVNKKSVDIDLLHFCKYFLRNSELVKQKNKDINKNKYWFENKIKSKYSNLSNEEQYIKIKTIIVKKYYKYLEEYNLL